VPPIAAADEEFDELCFEYGIELDDVVGAGHLAGYWCAWIALGQACSRW
jgi:hypothetical protein